MSTSFAADCAASESRMVWAQWAQGADVEAAVAASCGALTLCQVSGTSMGYRRFSLYRVDGQRLATLGAYEIQYCHGAEYAPGEHAVRELLVELEAQGKMTGNDSRGFSAFYALTEAQVAFVRTLRDADSPPNR